MQRLILFLSILLLLGNSIIAQDTIQAVADPLFNVTIGTENNQVDYSSGDGYGSLGSPFINAEGQICFYKGFRDKQIVIFKNKSLSSLKYKGSLMWYRELGSRQFHSQQGILLDVDPLAYNKDFLFDYSYEKKNISIEGSGYNSYSMPFGSLLYSEKQKEGIAIVFDISNPTEEFSVIPQGQLRAWLPTQPGGFTIGDDGLLYRNGVVWSALLPKGWDGSRFAGKLMSGHNVWAVGNSSEEGQLIISDSRGNIEMFVNIPWGNWGTYEDPPRLYNWGLGPWGEMYCLIPPESMWEKREAKYGGYEYVVKDSSKITEPAELVVVRNYLKYFGRLNDGGVRLRKEPTTSGEILGTYPAKTGFRILETGTKSETIGGQKNVWYKVRLLDGTEGWFFGAFVHNLYDGPNGNPPPWPNVPDW
jgi:hypothetical protein